MTTATENDRQNGRAALTMPTEEFGEVDVILNVVNNVRVSDSMLRHAQGIVLAKRAAAGLQSIPRDQVTFKYAFEQVNWAHKGSLMLIHDTEDMEAGGVLIMVPPGRWWFDKLEIEAYEGMMAKARSDAAAAAMGQ